MVTHEPREARELREARREAQAARDRRLNIGVAAFRWIFVLALLRMFATPATKDFFDEELLPSPTWEWALCSLTPGLLIWLARAPKDWRRLEGERSLLRIALALYFLYALAFALGQNVLVHWIAVAASLAGFAGMWHLNRKEQPSAR
ncbi:hypothetical protein [Streptomyces sp. Je 1-369]|uniref:hypothetical protein n=1 Tax=Streptomyces sp. Je 1-369 TaxID=2966192 RepID=UPI002286592E|nr:hypothetical protein [Streptomyces sp. Je 1-369]WAL97187.1 hypothetical protein NOO62_23450 [Streptomyces sp. Je 1-369]